MPDLNEDMFKQVLGKRPKGMSTDDAIRKMIDKGYTFGGKTLDRETLKPVAYHADKDSDQTPESRSELRDIALHAAEGTPAATGGLIGAALGLPFGPGGRIVGAGIGGAAGEASKILGEEVYDIFKNPAALDKMTSSGVAKRIAAAGAAQAIGEGVGIGAISGAGKFAKTGLGQELVAGIKAGKDWAIKTGTQLIRAASTAPERSIEMVLKDPSIMSRALPPHTVGKMLDAFESKWGLKNLGQVAAERAPVLTPEEIKAGVRYSNPDWTAGELKGMVNAIGKRLRAGAQVISPKVEAALKASGEELDPMKYVTMQEAYLAGRAENKIGSLAMSRDPVAISMIGSKELHADAQLADEALQRIAPAHKVLNRAWAESKAREAMSFILPQNKNMSPNVLRTWGAAGAAGYEATKGNPIAAMATLMAVSPKTYGTTIKYAPAAAGAAEGLAGISGREALAAGADMLSNPLSVPKPTPPTPATPAAGEGWRSLTSKHADNP